MPADMPPNYAYVADAVTQDYVQSIELKHDAAGYAKGSEVIYYSSSMPHLSETLLDRIHNNLDYVDGINYQNAMLPYQKDIQEKLPKVSKQMDSLNYRAAYQELVKEGKKEGVAKDVLFEVDNEILSAMPDFQERLDTIKVQEQEAAMHRLKSEGILFNNGPAPEGLSRIGSKQDFAVQPVADIQSLEDELTGHDANKEVVLYRLKTDKDSLLRASVSNNMQEEQTYAVCRARELSTIYQYNKYVHDLVDSTPAAKDFFQAQSIMNSVKVGGEKYGYAISKDISLAMRDVSPTYAKYGHVSTNPLQRVEESVEALAKVLEKKKYADSRFNQYMITSGINTQLKRDLQKAPAYYNENTPEEQKQMVDNLQQKLLPQTGTVLYAKTIPEVAPSKDAPAR